jgi:hypothetical protein
MSSPDIGGPALDTIYKEFKTTVAKILDLENTAEALSALRALATRHEGGQGGDGDDVGINGDYTDAMKGILAWGMKVFVNVPDGTGGHLWVTLRLVDGPSGYNQGYVIRPMNAGFD